MFVVSQCLLFVALIPAIPAQTTTPPLESSCSQLTERISVLEQAVEDLATQQRKDHERIIALEQTLRGGSSNTETKNRTPRDSIPDIHGSGQVTTTPSSIRVADGSEVIPDASSLTRVENDPIITTDEAPTSRNGPNVTRFFEAAERGDIYILREFVREYPDIVRRRNPQGYTALHLAARAGKEGVVGLLLDGGERVETRGRNLQTALHCAAASGHVDVVSLLLRKQHVRPLYIEWLDSSGRTPLRLAIDAGHVDVIRILAPFSDEVGLYAVQMVAERNMNILTVLLNTEKPLNALHLQNALNNAWNEESLWAVIDAADYKSIEEVSFTTALFHASKDGRAAALKPIISFGGANIGFEENGRTPLGIAVENKQLDCVRELTSLGTNTSGLQQGISALKVAARVDCAECIQLITDSGFVSKTAFDAFIKDGTLIKLALDNLSLKCVKFLIKKGASITKDEISRAILVAAVTKCDTEVLKIFIDIGADINFIVYPRGISLLSVTVQNRKKDCVQLLLSSGANPNLWEWTPYGRSNTPLHEALIIDDLDIAKVLLEFGADVGLVGTNNELVKSVQMKNLLESFSH